jgi:hypothetical protein
MKPWVRVILTLGIFYRDLNDSLSFKGLIEVLSKAQEYDILAKEFPEGQGLWARFEKQVEQEVVKHSIDLKALKKVKLGFDL